MSSMPSFRGGYAPRRGRGGWNKPFLKTKREFIKPDVEKKPLGQLLRTIRNSNLGTGNAGSFVATPISDPISDLQYIASYNWRDDGSTTIIVPGKPPQWTPVKDAHRLSEDSGQYYRDPNAAKYPQYPIAPLVESVLDINPNFSTEDVDIVACGSTLGNLLRFVRKQDKAFRFGVETIGNTVFFLRKENDPKEIIPDVRGYGHTFPEANTTWEKEVKGSETHQRIVQYEFGGFTCLVRFECDGYIKDKDVADRESKNKPISLEVDNNLLFDFNKAAIAKSLFSQNLGADGIKVERGGSEVPQRSIFDLKTRSGKNNKDINMSDIYPLLWIKQVPNFIVAYHDGAGLFRDVRVQDIRKGVQEWEKDNIDAIRRLEVLLKEIVMFATSNKGLLEVYSPHKDCLELRKQYGEGEHALPDELRDRWVRSGVADTYLSDSDDGGYTLGGGHDSDNGWNASSDGDEPDYTACSAEDCGYCGKCTY